MKLNCVPIFREVSSNGVPRGVGPHHASAMADRAAKLAAQEEKARREKERQEFMAAQELETLRRAFKRLDKNGDKAIDVDELLAELEFLGHSLKPSEAALTIWEVDDDADGVINWDEFRQIFFRIRDDCQAGGCEPRKLFYVIEFLMNDKNLSGSMDLDECCTLLYGRYGKAVIDEIVTEVFAGVAPDQKSVSFSTFVNIQKKAVKKISDSSSGLVLSSGRMLPQVKDLKDRLDPTLAHLFHN